MTITISEKGRILISGKIREELCLKTGEKMEMRTEGKKITLLHSINPEDFIARMEGKLKSGNKTVYPTEIKSIWRI